MRAPEPTCARLQAPRALCAGVVFLAAAFVPAAQASDQNQTALAVPRVAPLNSDAGAALPQPLTPSDAALVRRAFVLESSGDLPAADRVIGRLQNDLLLGQLDAARYLGRFHRATPAELTGWLRLYADEPDAPAILALLRRRLPAGIPMPPLPPIAAVPAISRMARVAPEPPVEPASASPPAAARSDREIRSLFTGNSDSAALALAQRTVRTTASARSTGSAAYVGGLAAWRLDDVTEARRLFAIAATAPRAEPHLLAAAAFWSSRAADRDDDPAAAAIWLHRAATWPTTLHGLLARKLLDMSTGIATSETVLAPADIDAIAALAGGWRAFALLQVDQPERAAAEFRGLWPSVADDPALRHALVRVAAGVGLTDCAVQLAAWSAAAETPAEAALQPALPPLRPAGGFRVSPALVYAVARVESNFDPAALSPAGASGLMQLMPATANYVSDNPALNGARLHDPAVNLALGQRYMLFLAAQDSIRNDLLRVLASYNDGLGGFAHWSRTVHDDDDPLLFIEAIPVDETRHFVQRALTWSWRYAARLHLPAPSLDDMASGVFPRFTPLAVRGRIVEAGLH